jgi:hypothetical protein
MPFYVVHVCKFVSYMDDYKGNLTKMSKLKLFKPKRPNWNLK